MKLLKTLALCVCVSAVSYSVSADPVLVGNSILDGAVLSESDTRALLMGKKVKLNGSRVVIVLEKASDNQDSFLRGKIGKTTAQFNNHWRKLFMTGGGTSPKQVSDTDELIAMIASTEGAIGIIDESAAGDLPIIAR